MTPPDGQDPDRPDPPPAATPGSFTGIRRERKTKLAVKIKDTLAQASITVGGIGTIAAVALVCIFLAIKVVPLFVGGSTESDGEAVGAPSATDDVALPVRLTTDEYRLMVAAVTPDGQLRVTRLGSGEIVKQADLFPEGPEPTAWSFDIGSERVAVGFADGTVRLGELGYRVDYLLPDSVPPEVAAIGDDETVIYADGVVERTTEGQLRHQRVHYEFGDPISASPGSAIRMLDYVAGTRSRRFVTIDAERETRLYEVRIKKNMLTGEMRYRTDEAPVPPAQREGAPAFIGLTGLGDNIWRVWEDGTIERVDCRMMDDIAVAETLDLIPDGSRATTLRFLNGRTSLLVGDSTGHVGAWFRRQAGEARDDDPSAPQPRDGMVLVRGHYITTGDAAVTDIAVSDRTRLMAAGHADGAIGIYNVTTESLATRCTVVGGDADPTSVHRIDIAPKDDGLVALAEGRYHSWILKPGHHEVNVASLILPVHYEARPEPDTIWQSSSGDDAFEPKFGLWPLIFGTLKATFYALVFGVPVALLAAIYTSEFLHPKAKSTVKPMIEMMASLPSVVLGFLAGIVIASWVEERIAGVVLSIVMVPLALLLGARLWQLLPRSFTIRYPWLRLVLMVPAILLGVLLARLLTTPVEHLFFWVQTVDTATGEILSVQYDLKAWLSAHHPATEGVRYVSSGIAGWLFLFLPLAGMVVGFFNTRYVNGWLRDAGGDWSEFKMALADLVRFLANAALTVIVALAMSVVVGWILGDARSSQLIGWFLLCLVPAAIVVWALHLKVFKGLYGDGGTPLLAWIFYSLGTLLSAWVLALVMIALLGPLGSFVDTYVQRNALVVGFIMGFAIIPIIYTISEDALSSVPTHLRSASLGSGATPWQTAIRIILPTAMSGVFSAIMIGLGRAVGETMIVLMAAGNTPVLSMNIFDGFRTLSANIAVELPEAPRDGTHYRVLFLAALVLFAMTFVLNTLAEAVRQRFRKRAFEL